MLRLRRVGPGPLWHWSCTNTRPDGYSLPVYHALLTRRYLTSKVMPLLASLAVVLCTAMVLITWSVMGGFLNNLTQAGRSLIGDVRIAWPNVGFAYYDDLVARLEADPAVEAAAPLIEGMGMLTLLENRTEPVLIRGIEGESFSRVTNYEDTLWWKPLEEPMPKDKKGEDLRLEESDRPLLEHIYQDGLTLTEIDPATGQPESAIVLGMEVGGWNKRTDWGGYYPRVQYVATPDGGTAIQDIFMPGSGELVVLVVPLDSQGRPLEPVTRKFPVANEFESGLYDIDKQTVLMELGALQRMLRMHAAKRLVEPGGSGAGSGAGGGKSDPLAGFFEEDTEEVPEPEVVEDPARVTSVLVRMVDPDGDLVAFREKCHAIYAEFARAHPGEVPDAMMIGIETWEDANRMMISAVKKETGLVLMIFSFISFTAVFLVFAIFWAMISEKTKDIGILRALGASRLGVAWIWLRYGLAIGVVGSLCGGLLAWVIVTNINEIHEGGAAAGRWLGDTLTGTPWNWYIWDPKIYVFKEIPHKIEPWKAAFVLVGGLLSCVLGALWPAVRAARMHPVKALRFE
ncbi:Lipoprotein releasing system transmembrane protein LolC [hydrothermal vent metagenome]|uniref:Lipoprotein releasing system transmembrane protein LolC n=1 Tax=hydrothermal vent metagenome TaxID=652676 RepID=A0A3B1E3F0_9ZZZZ